MRRTLLAPTWPTRLTHRSHQTLTATHRTLTTTTHGKPTGDISDAFASLAGKQWTALDPRFAAIKSALISGHEREVHASWNRLLAHLRSEIPLIAARGSSIIPSLPFSSLSSPDPSFTAEHKKRGVAVIRNVLPPSEALALKASLREYISANPGTRAFPPENPQVYELYWSRAQLLARSHPNILATQRFLMGHWSAPPAARVSTQHPIAYADRLRMRLPGDARFALGPHVDGGSCERWEPAGYGCGGVYDAVWRGEWEDYDPWAAAPRLPVVSDLYSGSGACSAFRMYQGWLALSETGPREGTLLVNPLLGAATAYFLLRPFFEAVRSPQELGEEEFLGEENWRMAEKGNSWVHGATPGHGQELREHLHPHLLLEKSMVHVSRVQPGDYVAWHCDAIHAVDRVHEGASDSSVLYIPACPLTEANARYLGRQRECFVEGVPSPDFPGGEGERAHVGRWGVERLVEESRGNVEGLRAMGLAEWDGEGESGLSPGQREVLHVANKELGFYD